MKSVERAIVIQMHGFWQRVASLAFLVLVVSAPAAAHAQTAPESVSISASSWSPGPHGSGDYTFSGTADQPTAPNATTLTGWVVDTSAQGWAGIDDVQIWTGLMDGGGQLLAHPIIQVNRPDVAAALNNPYWANSGYSASIPSNTFQNSPILYVYAHTPAKGWWYQTLLLSAGLGAFIGPKLDVETPTNMATVHNTQPYAIRGTAYDPAATPAQGTGVDRVQVYLNGDQKSGVYIGDATLGQYDQYAAAAHPEFANSGWVLMFQPSSWIETVTDNTITPMTVCAHSTVTGQVTCNQLSIVVTLP
jgi:hypothetical protein